MLADFGAGLKHYRQPRKSQHMVMQAKYNGSPEGRPVHQDSQGHSEESPAIQSRNL